LLHRSRIVFRPKKQAGMNPARVVKSTAVI
jgi:hypothetical protein